MEHTYPRKGPVMRQLKIYAIWAATAAGLLAAIFAPNFGLIHGEPTAAIGLGLIGGGMMVEYGR